MQEGKICTWTEGLPVDEKAMQQVRNTASLPFVWPHVALMADYHFGLGATVGSVVPTLGAVIPAAVGVDIGCGMQAVLTNLTADDINPTELFATISAAVPHGRSNNGQAGDKGAWTQVPADVRAAWANLGPGPGVESRHPKLCHPFALRQLGTLGTGNHFIEVSLDEDQRVWAVLHSGSRGPGNRIGTYFIGKAKEAMKRWHITLPDPDLAYLPEGEPLFDDYWAAVQWAQKYAKVNRALMMERVLEVLGGPTVYESIDCHHNYVARERHFGKDLLVTRKGAVSAKLGEWGIIPGCFAAGTRVLMADGLYSNIEDLKVGDRVISGTGHPATVTGTFRRGVRSTWRYRNNNFHADTAATPDHRHFIGDMPASHQKTGRVIALARPTGDGTSRFKWAALSELPVHPTLLAPRAIKFLDMRSGFEVRQEGHQFSPSYAMGYVFGSFLGNGTTRYKRGDGGQISWSFDVWKKQAIAARLVDQIQSALGVAAKTYQEKSVILVVVHDAALARFFGCFGKRTTKALPEPFWCSDPSYLQGLYDGLIDTDGHTGGGTKKLTNTSTRLIEQFGVIHHLLFGYLPSISRRKPSAGGLPGVRDEDCQTSYRATSLKAPNAVLTRDHQLVAMLKIDRSERVCEVFDIEVDGAEHSFIANNVIVHNSMGAKTFITKGRGNRASLCSSSHGAGRAMSRTAARSKFSVADHVKATEGVVCLKDASVLDETPGAYKDINAVMKAQEELVEVVHTLRQVVSVKGEGAR